MKCFDKAASALLAGVIDGNMRAVQAALEAGADINGHSDLPCVRPSWPPSFGTASAWLSFYSS